MTTLLHEVVHNVVFRHAGASGRSASSASLYAITSGISASQFTRWHLDHHDNLGSYEDDPKRHWLSPKRNARWYKLLYCTPVLMPLYFRAAAQRGARPTRPELRRTIARERLATIVIQLSAGGPLLRFGGAGVMARIWAVPYFLVFPVAFTLNRLGQHYNIDPSHPLKWSTVMKPSRIWDFLFLYSNYHAEHHYFPSVPFYNLRKAALRPAAALRAPRRAAAHLSGDRLAVVRAEPRAPHGLGEEADARWSRQPRRARRGSARRGAPRGPGRGAGGGSLLGIVPSGGRAPRSPASRDRGRPGADARSSAPCPRASPPTGRASRTCAGSRRARGTCRRGSPSPGR